MLQTEFFYSTEHTVLHMRNTIVLTTYFLMSTSCGIELAYHAPDSNQLIRKEKTEYSPSPTSPAKPPKNSDLIETPKTTPDKDNVETDMQEEAIKILEGL